MTREELAARLYVEAADLLLEAQSEESKRLGKEAGRLKRQYIDNKTDEKIQAKMDILNYRASNGEMSVDEYIKAREKIMSAGDDMMNRLGEARAAARNSPKAKARKIIADAADDAMKKRNEHRRELQQQISKRHEDEDKKKGDLKKKSGRGFFGRLFKKESVDELFDDYDNESYNESIFDSLNDFEDLD